MTTNNAKQREDLADRTFRFAQQTRKFILSLRKNICLFEDCKQLVRSSGSIGANYIEANEALSVKDKIYRIKICKKEARETVYWLQLIKNSLDEKNMHQWQIITKEATELLLILSAITNKYKTLNP